MNGFMGDLVAKQLDDPRYWMIYIPFTYRVGDPNGDMFVNIPRGFVTDFASIPRGLWNVFPPATSKFSKAAVVHDLLYKRGYIERAKHHVKLSRKECDDILMEAMDVAGCSWLTRHVIYAGVRVGGWKPWNAYRKADYERVEQASQMGRRQSVHVGAKET